MLAWRLICLYIIQNSSLSTFDGDNDDDDDDDDYYYYDNYGDNDSNVGDNDGFYRYLLSWIPC
jgi:hypothetical protein